MKSSQNTTEMLDLNIPTTTQIISSSLSPQEDDILLPKNPFATEMSNSLQFDFVSNPAPEYADASAGGPNLNWNLSQQLPATAGQLTTTTTNESAGSSVAMVNVATNFVYDWCNQTSSSSSSAYAAINTEQFSVTDCSSLYANSWPNATNSTSV